MRNRDPRLTRRADVDEIALNTRSACKPWDILKDAGVVLTADPRLAREIPQEACTYFFWRRPVWQACGTAPTDVCGEVQTTDCRSWPSGWTCTA